MPQSLAALNVHLVFSTKDRTPCLRENIRAPLHAYLSGILSQIGCQPLLINSVEDHVHLLFNLGRTVAISQAVEALKTGSSKWLKTRDPELAQFAWQSGYGAFSVSESNLATVSDYIAKQPEHHRTKTFQDELRGLLQRHGLAYNEQYVWD